jgi:hydroxymethylpyrimidine pyrophosphatase-like HAD family hydrolase
MRDYKSIVLLDLDGTLINKEYHLTIPEERVANAIRKIQANNTLVGLNSDTPLLPLRSWARCLGMNGPLVAEKGQVLAISPEDSPKVLGTMAEFFQDMKQQVAIRSYEEIPGAFIGIGDVTEFVRHKGKIYGEDQVAVLINGYRRCSFSAFALAVRSNNLEIKPEVLDRFTDLVLSVVGINRRELEKEDKNPDYGILILHEKGASKTVAVERLIEQMGTDTKYVMIGDSNSDIITTCHPIRLCAVGNACPELKERSTMVAQADYTAGVVEILNKLSLFL